MDMGLDQDGNEDIDMDMDMDIDGDIWWYVCTLCYRVFTDDTYIIDHKRARHPESSVGLKDVLVLSQLVHLEPKIRIPRASPVSRQRSSTSSSSSKQKRWSKRTTSHPERSKITPTKSPVPISEPSNHTLDVDTVEDVDVCVKEEISSNEANNDDVGNYVEDDSFDWFHDPEPDTGREDQSQTPELEPEHDVGTQINTMDILPVSVKEEPEDSSPTIADNWEPEPINSDFISVGSPKVKAKRRSRTHANKTKQVKADLKTRVRVAGRTETVVKKQRQGIRRRRLPTTKSKRKRRSDPGEGLSKTAEDQDAHGSQKIPGALRNSAVTCPTCGNVYIDRRVLKRHQEEVHGGARAALCAQCGAAFKHERHLQMHYRTHDPDNHKSFVCQVCSKTFYTDYLLRRHGTVHRAPSLECPVPGCDRLFKDGTALLIHTRRAHAEERPYKCDRCEATFKLLTGLQLHARTVHRDGADGLQFSCPKCPKTFQDQPALREHVVTVHQEGKCGSVRPHTCPICGLELPDRDSKKLHELEAHEYKRGTRKFECRFCNKRYANTYYLQRHEVVHERARQQQTTEMEGAIGGQAQTSMGMSTVADTENDNEICNSVPYHPNPPGCSYETPGPDLASTLAFTDPSAATEEFVLGLLG